MGVGAHTLPLWVYVVSKVSSYFQRCCAVSQALEAICIEWKGRDVNVY